MIARTFRGFRQWVRRKRFIAWTVLTSPHALRSGARFSGATLATAVAIVAAGAAIWQGQLTRDAIAVSEKSLGVALAQTRPMFALVGQVTNEMILVRIVNQGDVPGRLVWKNFTIWTDHVRAGEQTGVSPPVMTAIFPGADQTIVRLRFTEAVVRQHLATGAGLGLAACIVYEPTEVGDSRRWVAELWTEWARGRAGSRELRLIRVDDKPLPEGAQAECDTLTMMPPGWKRDLEAAASVP